MSASNVEWETVDAKIDLRFRQHILLVTLFFTQVVSVVYVYPVE